MNNVLVPCILMSKGACGCTSDPELDIAGVQLMGFRGGRG